jgi:hypothetical protein
MKFEYWDINFNEYSYKVGFPHHNFIIQFKFDNEITFKYYMSSSAWGCYFSKETNILTNKQIF